MRALSLHQPYASWIARGLKKIETRKYSTKFRGDLLICSTKKPDLGDDELPVGVALCIVEIYHVEPMLKAHETAACCEIYENAHSWFFRNLRRIKNPFPVKGSQGFYEVALPEDIELEEVKIDLPQPAQKQLFNT